MFILSAGVPGAGTLYAVIFIVVLISVVLQGGLVPVFARLFHVPMRLTHPRPWSVDVRFAEEPAGLERHTVQRDSPADGSTIADLSMGERAWISVITRDGRNLPVRNSTKLRAGDVVLTQVDPDHRIDGWFAAEPP